MHHLSRDRSGADPSMDQMRAPFSKPPQRTNRPSGVNAREQVLSGSSFPFVGTDQAQI